MTTVAEVAVKLHFQILARIAAKWRSNVHTGISSLRLKAAVTASTNVIG